LGGLPDSRADACSGCASDEGSFQTSAEYSAQDRAARGSNGRALAGADAAALLVEALVVAVVSVARIIILSAVAAFPDAFVEVLAAAIMLTTIPVMALLRHSRERCQQKSGGEENVSPQHLILSTLPHPRITTKYKQTHSHCRLQSKIGGSGMA
jgi:hypothetical protein